MTGRNGNHLEPFGCAFRRGVQYLRPSAELVFAPRFDKNLTIPNRRALVGEHARVSIRRSHPDSGMAYRAEKASYFSEMTKLTVALSFSLTLTRFSQVLGSEKMGRGTLCWLRTSTTLSRRKTFQPSCQATIS